MNEINALEVFSESRNSAPAELPKFKNELLNEKTAEIKEIQESVYTTASDAYYKISCIMSEIKQGELYKEDGFKDLAEFGEKVFNFKRSLSYSYSRAGDIYRNESLPAALRALPPSKLDALSAVDTDGLVEAVNKGEINPNSTQKELREFNANYKNKQKGVTGKVIPKYTLYYFFEGNMRSLYKDGGYTDIDAEKIAIDLINNGDFPIDFGTYTERADLKIVTDNSGVGHVDFTNTDITIVNANYTYKSQSAKKNVTVKRKIFIENVSNPCVLVVTYEPYSKRVQPTTVDDTFERAKQAYLDGKIDAITFQLVTGKSPDDVLA